MATELPITKNPTARYVPWTIGLMMYLASIAAFLFIICFHFFGSWKHDFLTHVTLEIPTQTLFSEDLSARDIEDVKNQIVHLLQPTLDPSLDHDFPIKNISLFSIEEEQKLLSLWLGDDTINLRDLPLPLLMEIELYPDQPFNKTAFEERLKLINSSIRLLPPPHHFSNLAMFGFSLEIFLLALMMTFIITAILTISFAARTSLLIHKYVIDILSLLGASDQVIAQEFQYHARSMAIRGALICYCLLLPTFFLGILLFNNDTLFSLPFFALHYNAWSVLLALGVPVFMGFFMLISSRFNIQKMLKQLNRS